MGKYIIEAELHGFGKDFVLCRRDSEGTIIFQSRRLPLRL